MLLSFIGTLLLSFSPAHASEINIYRCENGLTDVINLRIDRALLDSVDQWTISGDDETHPFDCTFGRQAKTGNFVFACASDQGTPYGYLSIDKNFAQTKKIRFVYVDENNMPFSETFSGTCTRN